MNSLPYVELEGKQFSDAWIKFVADGCPCLEGQECAFANRLAWPKPEHICENGHLIPDPYRLFALAALLWGKPSLDDPQAIQDADEFRKLLVTSEHIQNQVGILIDNAAGYLHLVLLNEAKKTTDVAPEAE